MARLPTLRYKRNARMPAVRVQVLAEDGSAVDLSTASSASLSLRKPDATVITGALTIEAGAQGWVTREWGASDLSVAGVGAYEIDVTWPGALAETFPKKGYGEIWIEADL